MVWKAHKQTKQEIEIEINEIERWIKTRLDSGDADAITDLLKFWEEKEARRDKLREVLKLLNQT